MHTTPPTAQLQRSSKNKLQNTAGKAPSEPIHSYRTERTCIYVNLYIYYIENKKKKNTITKNGQQALRTVPTLTTRLMELTLANSPHTFFLSFHKRKKTKHLHSLKTKQRKIILTILCIFSFCLYKLRLQQKKERKKENRKGQ